MEQRRRVQTSDESRAALTELLRSVYVTPWQRQALEAALSWNAMLYGLPPADNLPKVERRAAGDLEDERHALLGPCGAE